MGLGIFRRDAHMQRAIVTGLVVRPGERVRFGDSKPRRGLQQSQFNSIATFSDPVSERPSTSTRLGLTFGRIEGEEEI